MSLFLVSTIVFFQPVMGQPTGSWFDHVLFIILENHSLRDITGTTAPYMTSLATNYSQSSDYQSAEHNSLSN